MLTRLVEQSLFGRQDATRSALTAVLVNSGYRRALRTVLVTRLRGTDTYGDAAVTRAFIRLLGKVATGGRDGRLSWISCRAPMWTAIPGSRPAGRCPTPPRGCHAHLCSSGWNRVRGSGSATRP
ncbi:hypothetical protein LV75_005215 [Actinokineospora diospyrosa]|uniref:Uncharacterized protein n=1 Tax=Actinokineospora diospyrosa TaxID=103728 RepID=A0ABT1IJF5_9PSEU|nr:hypothetical protein [Actinokineospora diospyrosa]